MRKKELRKQARDIFKQISANEKTAIERHLAAQLWETTYWENAEKIGITISMDHEWNTKPIIEKAWEQKKIVAVPKCLPTSKQLKFYQLESFAALEESIFNLHEPKPAISKPVRGKDLDLVIVPGLLFDAKGYRIGFGGGYYDRFLATYPHTTISLLSHVQLVHGLPYESFDIPVDILLTDHLLYG